MKKVPHSWLVFCEVLGFYHHDSAIVDEGAQIGDGSRILHVVHVCAGARIGKELSLGQNVFVGNTVSNG
ncbi:hypothetical protein ACV357_34730, partial [Pseudomonas aeruginosa]